MLQKSPSSGHLAVKFPYTAVRNVDKIIGGCGLAEEHDL